MDSGERSAAFWMVESGRAKDIAAKMKNPMAQRGMENIAASYEAFARRVDRLSRQGPVAPGLEPTKAVAAST